MKHMEENMEKHGTRMEKSTHVKSGKGFLNQTARFGTLEQLNIKGFANHPVEKNRLSLFH